MHILDNKCLVTVISQKIFASKIDKKEFIKLSTYLSLINLQNNQFNTYFRYIKRLNTDYIICNHLIILLMCMIVKVLFKFFVMRRVMMMQFYSLLLFLFLHFLFLENAPMLCPRFQIKCPLMQSNLLVQKMKFLSLEITKIYS